MSAKIASIAKIVKEDLGKDLRTAASNGDLGKVKELVEKYKVDVNAIGQPSGRCALHWAAEKGHIEVVEYLLSRENIELIKDRDNQTPYDIASNIEIKRKLTAKFKLVTQWVDQKQLSAGKGFDIAYETVFEIPKYTLEQLKIFMATANSYYVQGLPILLLITLRDPLCFKNDKIKYLLSLKIDPNLKADPIQVDVREGTVLHSYLANEKVKEAILFLIMVKEHGLAIKPAVQDALGKTILHMAAILNAESFLKMCFKNFGSDGINAQDQHKFTALHYAYLLGSQESVSQLLKNGADKNIVDDKGRKPEDLLKASEQEVAKTLKDFHIDPARKVSPGVTQLQKCMADRKALLAAQSHDRDADVSVGMGSLPLGGK